MENKQRVPFDPGFSKFTIDFPADIHDYLDEIAKLKQNHQKKFAFVRLEAQIVPVIKHCSAVYLGCILWGSYLFWKYKDNPAEISGNSVLSMEEDEKNSIDYTKEADFILNFIEKFEKAANHYLQRSSQIPLGVIKFFEVYKEFVILNDNFKNLQFTNEIKLPDATAHFENLDEKKLDELKQKIDDIINSGNIENIFNLINRF